MSMRYPGEPAESRAARDRLLEREIELRRAPGTVAAARRELPHGVIVPEDHVFREAGEDCSETDIRLWEARALRAELR